MGTNSTDDQRVLRLMSAGVTRRQLLRMVGVSAATAMAAGLLVACDDSDADDDSVSADETDGAADDPDESTDENEEIEVDEEAEDDVEDEGDVSDDAADADGDRPNLVVAVQEIPEGLDPNIDRGNVGSRITYSMFDNVLERDFMAGEVPGGGFGIKPKLAESWERLDDLTLELILREDVFFHNGDQLTAEDVAYSFNLFLKDTPPELSTALNDMATLETVEAVDDYVVHMTTYEPDPILLNRLTGWSSWVLPKKYHEEVGLLEFGQAPVGSGPYQFGELVAGDRIVLEAYDDYWGGPPAASHVEFRELPEVSSRVAALVSGEVDIITNIPPDQVETIENASGVRVESVPLANFHVLLYNTNHPSTSDVRVRQAMNISIDRALLVETLWGGRALLPRSYQLEEWGDMYNPDRPYIPYDPDRARELIAESDYDGGEIVYYTQPDYYTLGADAAQAIVEMWNEVGLNARVEFAQDLQEIPFDEMVVRNWSNSGITADPDGQFIRTWGDNHVIQNGSSSWAEGEAFWTPEGPFNEIAEAAKYMLDTEERYNAYQELLDIWEEEAPGTVLYAPMENYGVRDGVNWQPYSFYWMDLRPHNFSFD